ncbi:MAG: hypothetical protein U0931_16620 [Vulcanimicrobiota bacterium]
MTPTRNRHELDSLKARVPLDHVLDGLAVFVIQSIQEFEVSFPLRVAK